mmetsp:Transcript_31424/g.37418  ORF Transcript_31424/g.37418 Transcript_31424/m.37418 type:complete len:323 (+) Transcript_31424:57-1025(+)
MLNAVVLRGRTSLQTSFLSKHGRLKRRTSFVPKCSYQDSDDISIYRSLVLQQQHQYRATSRRCFCATFVTNTNLGDEPIHSARIRIGDVEHEFRKDIDETDKPLIPVGFLPEDPSNEVLNHLQWMMAKDNLNQDMLLIGPPGSGSSYRRQLAFMYAEMTNQPVEILTLSSDITESELKQRRELISHQYTPDSNPIGGGGGTSVVFVDQPPVRAALKGRILILDGLEKVDRNVLPTLNNLLENREMNLEDGRFLLPSKRYSQLSSQVAHNTLKQSDSFLTPVHEKFRVIALGVPVPPYEGQTLDPPLRSRFQIRYEHTKGSIA